MNDILKKDMGLVSEQFPRLGPLRWNKKRKIWCVDGEIDICDSEGNYWDTFKIGIYIPNNYPYCIPSVFELSEKIERGQDRHIGNNGLCCLDIEHRLIRMSRIGVNLFDFIHKVVYPYFANQLYFERKGEYANGEFKHGYDGIHQFYVEELKLKTPQNIVYILGKILSKKYPAKEQSCPCGSSKVLAECHDESIDFLKYLGYKIIKSDISYFKSL